MASELLKNKALIQKLKEPEVPTVNFDLASTDFEELFTLPEPKPQELLDIQEDVRIQRQQDTMDKARPFLMDESVDFIERQNFAEKAIVKKGPEKGKLKIPLTSEQKEILEDVYGVKTFEAAKKRYGDATAQEIIYRIRAGKVYKGMKSPIVKGFGLGATVPVEQSPEAKKIIVAELNNLKVIKNKRAFFDFKEGDKWYKNLSKRLNNLSREPLNRAIKTIAQEEFPNSYIGKEGKKRYRQEMVVKTFIDSLEVNNGFTGNEKFSDVLKEFRGSKDHKFEQINKDFKSWAKGEYEVDGVDRSKLTPQQLKDIKNYKPNQKQIRSVPKEEQLKWMHGANDRFKNLSAREVEKKFFEKFPDAPKRAFLQRSNELVQIKRTGSVISGADSTIEYPWAKTEPDNRSKWLKETIGKQFGGNYGALIRRADQFREAGNIEDAIRLEKAADKYFGPKGIFRKATGEGEHPFSRIMGGADQELKINSLVRGDLNQFKRLNFDQPVIQLLNKYSLTKPGSVARQKIIDEIEDRKKLMNLLTETKNEKGIVDVVKFNYGQKKIGPSTQVIPIDKLDEMGKFNVQDFVVRGENYLKGFKAASEKAPVLMQDGKITTKKFKGKELQDLIAAIACPGKAMGGRIGFQDGTSCFEKGKKMVNTGKIPEGAGKINFIKFANKAMEIGRQSGRGLRTIGKFAIIPEMIIIGADTLIRTGMGDTLDEAFKRASDIYRTDEAYEQADAAEINRRMGTKDAEVILNLRKFNTEKQKLSSLEQQKEADLALAGDDFAETNIGMTEEEIEKFYAPKIQEQEGKVFDASISDAEEFEALAKETEFADKKGVDYKKSPVGAFLDYIAEKPAVKPITEFFDTDVVQEPDVGIEALTNLFKSQGATDKEIRGFKYAASKDPQAALRVLEAFKELDAKPLPEGTVRTGRSLADEIRSLQFEAAKTDPALAERYFGPSMMPFGETVAQTDLEEGEIPMYDDEQSFKTDRFQDFEMNQGIYALGGRVGFKDGPKDPGRRTFLKLMAGIMSLPLVGKFFKPAAPVVEKLANTSTKMPDWFPNFVQKFMNNSIGKKIDADLMQYKNPDLPGVTLTRNDDGRVFVEGKNEYNEVYQIEYEPPGYEVLDYETGKAVKTQGNFEAKEGRHVAMGRDDYDVEAFYADDLDEIAASDIADMEKYTTGKVTGTVKDSMGKDTGLKKGEYDLNVAQGRAEAEVDIARDLDDFYED
jgi:hypothetical protein